MKYLPKFKWNMLTEQVGALISTLRVLTIKVADYGYMTIAHEAAVHTARLRVEISQSRSEQQEYLKNVELARVLDKRAQRKQQAGKDSVSNSAGQKERADVKKRSAEADTGDKREERRPKKMRKEQPSTKSVEGDRDKQLEGVLGSIF